MEQLNEDQQNALSHFQEFTHINSIETCRQFLENHSWDVERAIETALISETESLITESEEPSLGSHDELIPSAPPLPPFLLGSTVQRRPPPPPPPSQHQSSTTSDNALNRRHTPNESIIARYMPHSLLQILRTPLQFLYATFIKVQSFFPWTVIRLVCSFVQSLFWAERDPVQELQDYYTYFDNQYDSRHPVFYRGKFSQALQDAKKEVRLLFVYLHEKNSPLCDRFCREVLCEDTIQTIIGNNLLWSASSDTQEGRIASRILHCTAHPCLCIIAHHGSQQTVQLKLQRYNGADECIAAVFDGVQNAEHVLQHNRNMQNQRGQRDRLLEEQNAAYLESVRVDQEKQKQKQLEQSLRQKVEEEERRIEDERQKKLQKFIEFRDNLKANLPVEPLPSESDTIQVSIRLPDNEPIRRRFRRNDPAKLLFEVAWTNNHVPEHFELLWGYPRQRYQYNKIGDRLIKDVIPGNSETCYLEQIEESDS
ncbi:unnamed protein product [Didymodactylos carnosus]|uniref:UBX domain-containing protein n=1 Tax=Didymodactylos carnosus TaxID=1234261 RepID=A0A813SEV2_9BILA|nr:unnamed protein product [Didymodactylos carnosus]CAF3579128.1 unnamed protein product [Didymodactylos carnosus]